MPSPIASRDRALIHKVRQASLVLLALASQTGLPPFREGPSTLRLQPAAISATLAEARRMSDGSLRIQNGVYRATFAATSGVAFTPKIDRQYDDRFTWRYRALGIERSTFRRDWAAVAPLPSALGGHIVEFARPGAIERYVGHESGIEQVFVLTEAPRGSGDVRIRGEVTFEGVARDTSGGLQYVGRADAEVNYGKPVAFDARGRSLPVRVLASGATLDLELDGASLQDAQFPVTIDPVISGPWTTQTGVIEGVDVALNSRRNEFLLVYAIEHPNDPSKADIMSKRFNAAGQVMAPPTLVSTGHYDMRPRVAFDLASNRYLVVWSRVPGFLHQTYARLLDQSGVPVAAEFHVNTTPGSFGFGPDVVSRGLDPHDTDDAAFFVVWREYVQPSTSIKGKRVSGNGSALSEATISMSSVNGSLSQSVAYDPHGNRFFAVWSHNGSIRGRSMHATTSAFGSEIAVSDLAAAADSPDVAFDPGSRRYLVCWTDSRRLHDWEDDNDPHVFCQFLSNGASPLDIGSDFAVATVWDTPGVDNSQYYPKVTEKVGGFYVGFRRQQPVSPPGPQLHIHGQEINAPNPAPTEELPDLHVGLGTAPGLATNQYGFTFIAHERVPSPGQPYADLRHATSYTHYAHFVHGKNGNVAGSLSADLILFRPLGGSWHVLSSAGYQVFSNGSVGDIPVLMDSNNDGLADLGVFRPSTGTWYVRDTATAIVTATQWGTGGDIPVPGDYVGDAADDFAVFRPSTGMWHVRDATTAATSQYQWGVIGDVPVPADYDAVGKTDLCVWRPSNGTWYKIGVDGSNATAIVHGQSGDIPLQGNFVGQMSADQVVFRAHKGEWHIRNSTTSAITVVKTPVSGHVGLIPMPLDYDHDGQLDLAVFAPTEGKWYIQDDDFPDNWTSIVFGKAGDLPAGGR